VTRVPGRLPTALLVVLAVAVAAARPVPAHAAGIVVFAAASLKNALDAVAAKWHATSGKTAAISYAASSTLAKQIDNGAPADLFISADLKWMDYLQQHRLIKPQSRVDLLGNALVLIAPKDSALKQAALTIAPGLPLAAMLGKDGRLAMADPTAVPAGLYGKAALAKLGIWPRVEHRIAAAQNVRAALALVARGEAPLGIVYRTDAAVEPAVRVIGTFPAGSHPPITYPLAQTVTARPVAGDFETYLRGPAAARVFEAQGFTVLANER
jgi:molybdate transport system substrate-binding protein